MTRNEVINLALGHSKYFSGEQSLTVTSCFPLLLMYLKD